MDPVGGPRSDPVEIVTMKAHHGPPGSCADRVVLIVELGPPPQEHERWWWTKQVAGDERPFAYLLQNDLLNVQFDISRDRLEEEGRRVRRAVRAANDAYPDRYDEDALARSHEIAGRVAERQQQLDVDQAVLDRVMEEPE